MNSAEIINKMITNDAFSNDLEMIVNMVAEGKVVLSLAITSRMTNGFGILHGAISYALADSCCAFAGNSFGNKAVTIESSISHIKKVFVGDQLSACSKMISKTNKIMMIEVRIENNDKELIALYKGTLLISSQKWE
jgi:acyl-CoA thioesterase